MYRHVLKLYIYALDLLLNVMHRTGVYGKCKPIQHYQ